MEALKDALLLLLVVVILLLFSLEGERIVSRDNFGDNDSGLATEK